jgi:hypothetical protein
MADVLRARGKLGPYTTTPPEPVEDPAAVREWAATVGLEVAARGPIRSAVIDQYRNRGGASGEDQ